MAQRQHSVYVTIEHKDGRLSITGVEGPDKNGGCLGSSGQIDMGMDADYLQNLHLAPGWTLAAVRKLLSVWREWHMNDMRPGCRHQTRSASWDTTRKLTLHKYTWTPRYRHMRENAANGILSDAQYHRHSERVKLVATACKSNIPHNHHVVHALADKLIRESGTKTEAAGWVHPEEHPDGLLMKPCPECGYKYGSEWKSEPVPKPVLDWLRALPETDRVYPWA